MNRSEHGEHDGRAVEPTRSHGGLWVVLQHVAHEGPGVLADVLDEAGCAIRVIRLDLGEELPPPGSFDGLVVMGGPMGAHDVDAHPWLADERELIAATVADDLAVLGICLGAQQLACALGAEVATAPRPEVGTGWVELTPSGRRDPVFGPEWGGLSVGAVPCVHWHADTFTLPDGAVHLAASRDCPHQAFRFGARAYGLQFHLEVDAALARAWQPRLPAGAEIGAGHLAMVETVGRRVLRRFVDRAADTRPVGSRTAAAVGGTHELTTGAALRAGRTR